jgi:hypothetical protein
VSTDKHQGPKKGPSARREQRKASSGSEESQHSPMRKTYLSLFFLLFFFYFFFCTKSLVNAQNNRDRSWDGPRRDLASGAGQLCRTTLGRNRNLMRTAADRIETGTGSSERRLAGGTRGRGRRRRNAGQRPAEERGAEAAAEELGAAAAGRRRLGDPMKSWTWSRSPSTRASTSRKDRPIRGDRRRSDQQSCFPNTFRRPTMRRSLRQDARIRARIQASDRWSILVETHVASLARVLS